VTKTWTPKPALELEHLEATLNYKIDYMGNHYGQRSRLLGLGGNTPL
jgi:hypothetical protein